MKFYSFWRSLAAFRVRIALNIKGIVPDEVVNVDLMKGDQCQPAYKAVNPQMRLPALIAFSIRFLMYMPFMFGGFAGGRPVPIITTRA